MLKIPLTQGKFAIVGPRDYKYLMQWKWFYLKHHSGAGYAVRTDYSTGERRTVYMHREILDRMGQVNFMCSDHINKNKLDNRRSNLRPATNGQNQYNQNRRRTNTSGYKGVSLDKRRNKWYARIRVTNRQIFLGCYNNPKEAARAYNEAAKKYHGKFASLNEV